MLAILNEDIIVRVSSKGTTEIGTFPKGVGLERLRFDGEKVIDLADLEIIHVRIPGELHAIPVPGSQPVTMTYADRKYLVNEGGTLRVLTNTEREEAGIKKFNSQHKARLRAGLVKSIGDSGDQIADISKLLFLVVDYLVNDSVEAKDALVDISASTNGVYSLSETKTNLIKMGDSLKSVLPEYHNKLEVK